MNADSNAADIAAVRIADLRNGGWLYFSRCDGRWYRLGWQQTLFGWAIVRAHGGDGVRGDRIRCPLLFEDFEAAREELDRQVHRRLTRGYVMQ